MINDLFILVVALYLVVRGSTMATKYAEALSRNLRLSGYTIGFIVIATISILPETFISVRAALGGMPSFGLGVLLGSNVADLTLICALLVFYGKRSLRVEGGILKNRVVYPLLLSFPLLLGMDGYLSRPEGVLLILAGAVFYYLALRDDRGMSLAREADPKNKYENAWMLVVSMTILLVGAHFTVLSAVSVANILGVSPVLIGILVVGLGTTLPELFFSLGSVTKKDDSLAIGDLLGTVLADATIVVGILSLISPFSFPREFMYLTGGFMVFASWLLFRFMRSGRRLTWSEACILLTLWVAFVVSELFTRM